jgi:CheY-like chemotaxis protein
MAIPARIEPVEQPSILFVDPGTADSYLPLLRRRFEVTSVSSEDQAIRALRAFQPTLVITELELPEGDGVLLCRQSKAFENNPPSVLAITAIPERVPEALKAGCDGVLVKPFAPNLLYARISRLLRLRAEALGRRTQALSERFQALAEHVSWQHTRSQQLIERPHRIGASTNIICREASCPSCGRGDAVAFDAASHRRMRYACLSCGSVWMGPERVG